MDTESKSFKVAIAATIAELRADLRTAADQCEALSKDLADHKQLIVIKNRQLDTMAQENQRLRELLVECIDFIGF